MDEEESPQKLPLWGSFVMAAVWVAIMVGAATLLVAPSDDPVGDRVATTSTASGEAASAGIAVDQAVSEEIAKLEKAAKVAAAKAEAAREAAARAEASRIAAAKAEAARIEAAEAEATRDRAAKEEAARIAAAKAEAEAAKAEAARLEAARAETERAEAARAEAARVAAAKAEAARAEVARLEAARVEAERAQAAKAEAARAEAARVEAARVAAAEAEAAKAEAARAEAARVELAQAEAARARAAEEKAASAADKSQSEVARPSAESSIVGALERKQAQPAKSAEVLSDADAKLYRQIFQAQKKAKWKTANKLIKNLGDKRLVGHVLAERYLGRSGYRSSYRELRSWLANYGDHPQARKVYKLALKKRPAGGLLPRAPVSKKGTISKLGYITTPPYRTTKRLTKTQRRRVRKLQARIRRQIGRKQLSTSEKLINGKEVQRLFDEVQIDDATASVAAGWFYHGNYQRAAKLARQAAVRSGQKVPLALWMSGLSAWRLEDYATAASHFEAYALTPDNSAWYAAAGAYWAARCHQRLGNQDKVRQWLERAAKFPRTFYGIIAGYRLGHPLAFDFAPRPLNEKRSTVLHATPEGARAMALLQVGKTRAAERELMGLEGWERPETAEAIMALAEKGRLPALSIRVAKWLIEGDYEGWEESQLDWAYYPVPPWEPQGGFTVDRALVYAVMRQESLFRRYAKSRVGARGLMQLVPSTASSMTKRYRFRGTKRNLLYRPELNMMLGQRYLAHLMKYRRIQGDLFRVATAYNGGPGNLRSWERRIKSEDDLLFIESLPLRESRMYVERVMMNLWIYRARLGQPAPTLAAVAADQVATYQALDGKEHPGAAWAEGTPRGGSSDGSSPWWKFW